VAQGITLGTRIAIAACGLIPDLPGREVIVTVALVLSAPGQAMTQTVFQAANKRYSSRKSRSASFNIWYLIMNLGAFVGGMSIDIVRLWLDVSLSWIFVVAAVLAVLNLVTTSFFIRHTEAIVDDDAVTDEAAAKSAEPPKKGWALLASVFGESAFWRFIVLMVAVLGVRAVFAYMYLLMPQYWVEVIEKTGSAKTDQGLLQAINPILILVGLILFIPIANRFNVFKMLVTGAFISAGSLLVMALPWEWFGGTMAEGYFAMSVVMLFVLSLGELVWSPKLTEYTAAIAPPGQEGTYLGLSMMPWFVAKLAVGAMSGHMLERWVPAQSGMKTLCEGAPAFWDTPEAMWGILFVWAIAGPIIALTFKRWLTRGADLDPAVKSTPAATRRFRQWAGAFGFVVVGAVAFFLYSNASNAGSAAIGPDGKPLAGAARSERDAQTCGCYFDDPADLGPGLCADSARASSAEESEEAANARFQSCLVGWYADPVARCPELCALVVPPGKPDEKAIGEHRAACLERCSTLANNRPVDSAGANWCAERAVRLK